MKLLLPILLLFSSFGLFSQKEITWDDLVFEFEEKWSEEYNAIYMIPKFEKSHWDLDSVRVKIKGFVTIIDSEVGFYTISKSKFKYGACVGFSIDLHKIIQTTLQINPREINLEKEHWIEGTLILNEDDVLQMNYILKDAVIVKR